MSIQGEVKWWRVLLGSFIVTGLLIGVAVYMNQSRLEGLDFAVFNGCAESRDPADLGQCVQWQVMNHLAEPHWLARLFIYYLLASVALGFVFLWSATRPVLEALFMAVLCALGVLLVFQPPWLLLIGMDSGVLSAGLVLKWRGRRS